VGWRLGVGDWLIGDWGYGIGAWDLGNGKFCSF